MHTIRKTFCLVAAAAVLASSFAASVHVHVHPHSSVGDNSESATISVCSCGFAHPSDSPQESTPENSAPGDTPCDHSDCQICKFISEFGWLNAVEIELTNQGVVEIHQQVWCFNLPSDVSEVYQGRAPPTV